MLLSLMAAQLPNTGLEVDGLPAGGIVQLCGGVVDGSGGTGLCTGGTIAASIPQGPAGEQGQILQYAHQTYPGTLLRSHKQKGFALPAESGVEGHGLVRE